MEDNPWGADTPNTVATTLGISDSIKPLKVDLSDPSGFEISGSIDTPQAETDGALKDNSSSPNELEAKPEDLAAEDETAFDISLALDTPQAPTMDELFNSSQVQQPDDPVDNFQKLQIEEAIEGPPMDDFPSSSDMEETETPQDTFDDDMFDDFGEPGVGQDNDDDFGDFDDFESTRIEDFGDISASAPSVQAPFWLDLVPSGRSNLKAQLLPFVQSVYPDVQQITTDEPERQVDGLGQILVTEPLRTMLQNLSSLPPLRPLDWRRSKIRRQHLITLGVPVNLDDAIDQKPLDSLVLEEPSSEPARESPPLPISMSRAATPLRGISPSYGRPRTPAQPPPPVLDTERANKLISISEDDLNLMSLEQLKNMRQEMEEISRDASEILTRALMDREKEIGDGQTYNGMIQDLVTAAARLKTTSGKSRPTSLSRNDSGSSVSRGLWSKRGAVR